MHDLGVITLARPASATPVVLPTAGLLDRLAARSGLRGTDFTNVGYGATGWAFGGGSPTLVNFTPAIRRISTSPFMALEPNVSRLLGNTSATGEGGVCVGDSGSAAYLNVAGTDVAVGIVSLGGDQRCVANDPHYRLDTPSAKAFLGQLFHCPKETANPSSARAASFRAAPPARVSLPRRQDEARTRRPDHRSEDAGQPASYRNRPGCW